MIKRFMAYLAAAFTALLLAVFGGATPAHAALTYFYAQASQTLAAGSPTTGITANMSVHAPAVASGDFHSLAELVLRSSDYQQAIEVGWRVVAGETNPRLFVFNWVNGTAGCYNGCGWVDYSSTALNAGDYITSAVGTTKAFGIAYSGTSPNGGWWISYGGSWIGHFPETDWGMAFASANVVNVYGEVAANSSAPCTDMGNGTLATSSVGAFIASVTYPSPRTTADVNLTTSATNAAYYSSVAIGTAGNNRSIRYGGPGAC